MRKTRPNAKPQTVSTNANRQMKKWTINLLTVAFLLLVQKSNGQTLSCIIKSDKTIYKKRETPKITLEIKNNSDSTIYLVKILDGSYRKTRFPYSYYKIEKLADTSYKARQIIGCGNEDGIDLTDFVEVKPNEKFDPYKDMSPPYTNILMEVNDPANFEKKGKYKITYFYSTNQTEFKKWMGFDMNRSWFDWQTKEIKPDKKETYNKLLLLFEKVPKVDLVSNDIIIEIK